MKENRLKDQKEREIIQNKIKEKERTMKTIKRKIKQNTNIIDKNHHKENN